MRMMSVMLLPAGLMVALPALADTVEGSLQLNLQQRLTVSAPLDASYTLDETQARSRLMNTRLGTWTGTTVDFLNVTHTLGIALNDPGQVPAPSTARQLLQVSSTVSLEGELLGNTPFTLPRSVIYSCAAGATQCSTATVTHTAALSPGNTSFAAPEQALGLLRAQATAPDFEILFPGTTVRLGPVPASGGLLGFDVSYHEIQGTVRFRATYETKDVASYVADALGATANAVFADRHARMAAATSDIAALRAANYGSAVLLPGSTPVAGVQSLHDAHAVLAVARDAVGLQLAGANVGASLATRFDLVEQLWNLTATANPALARNVAGFANDLTFFTDPTLEIGAVRAALESGDDAGFNTLLAHYSGAGAAVGGSAPVFTLDGALYGLDGALLQVFLAPGNDDGLFEIDLPGAERHALWKSGSTTGLSIVAGAAQGLDVPDWGFLSEAGSALYIGESTELLEFFTFGQSARIGLNNFYSPSTVVIASWGVTPVPLPASGVLLLGAVAVLARRRRAQRGA